MAKNLSGQILHKGRILRHEIPGRFWKLLNWRDNRNWKGSCYLPFPAPQLTPLTLLTNTLLPTSHSWVPSRQRGRKWEPRKGKWDWRRRRGQDAEDGAHPLALELREGLTLSRTDCVCLQAVAEQGYETGEHAPGLKLGGCGAYKAAHHIIKVKNLLKLCLKLCVS